MVTYFLLAVSARPFLYGISNVNPSSRIGRVKDIAKTLTLDEYLKFFLAPYP
jgi:hypothetical protein